MYKDFNLAYTKESLNFSFSVQSQTRPGMLGLKKDQREKLHFDSFVQNKEIK